MSERMEPIYQGEVTIIGANTCVIRIPAETARLMGLGKGSPFLMSKEGRTIQVVFPEPGETPKPEPDEPGKF